MHPITVVTSPIDAEQEMAQFGLTLPVAQKVARAASAGRASALDIDVAFAPGMFSHIYGHRQLRRELLPRGWRLGRQNNVESVVNDELAIQIVFQNVDLACDLAHSPQAISGKGAGARKLVQDGLQGELWDKPTIGINPGQTVTRYGLAPSVWMFCVSDDGKRLRAELSKPENFEGNQFGRFSKRIFVLDEEIGDHSENLVVPPSNDDDIGMDVEVEVVRR